MPYTRAGEVNGGGIDRMTRTKADTALGRRFRPRHIAVLLTLIVLAAACAAAPGDFTGDRKADLVKMDWSTGQWTVGSSPLYTGQPADWPVAGDYNGDLKWEPAVVRGTTWISSALADPIVYDPAGMPTGPAPLPVKVQPPVVTLPVPGDYDGSGKTVPAYYDQVDASWWIMGRAAPVQFGLPPTTGGTLGYDVPVPADYDGDGKTDIAVYRPTDGSFHYLSSTTGTEVVTTPTVPADAVPPAIIPIPGRYTTSTHAEAAVTDWNGSAWYVAGSSTPFATFAFAPFTDNFLPAPADYDGDGRTDAMLIDDITGVWWPAGQPRPTGTTNSGNNDRYNSAVFPFAVVNNWIRLTIYASCLLRPESENCTGVL